MNRWMFVVLIAVSNFCPLVFAEDGPKLSGIMNGPQPGAIINDQIVRVGDSLDGLRVVEIGADYVLCQTSKGKIELRLHEAETVEKTNKALGTKQPRGANSVKSAAAIQAPAPAPTSGSKDLKARKSLNRSIEYLKEGDALLKSPLVFERLYAKAASLCDDADREAQAAFRAVADDALRLGIKEHIDRVRQAKQKILNEKSNFNTRVRTLISAHQLMTGMTQRDVVSSWGQPLMQNRDGGLEKWIYQDNNGYQKELVFKDGIMVSF